MDKDSIPIPGVTIKIKETNLGVATDKEGKFSLTFPEMKNPTLVFTFIGMQKQEIPIQTQTMFLNVIMQEETKALDDVVVTGYATIRKESFTGTSTKVSKADLLKVSPLRSFLQIDPE